ncbi:P-loop containing nucleoside triphosphate hydrolase protein, partial [Mycena galopus ATCC 62051]
MPRLPTAVEIRIDNITACLTPALLLLTELNDAFGPPFVQSIANTIQSLINMVQNVKRNKIECAQLMEPIHQIVYGILNFHIKSETVGCLSPSMLDNIGTFMGTLHKIYAYIETQQEGKKIKNLFQSSEIKQLLQDCHAGLNQAIEVFITKTGAEIFNDVREFKKKADLMHKELIELIETLSDTGTISERSSILGVFNESKNSSNSFSMLPAKPKIFHGREQELEDVLNLLSEKSPRIAILGGGGMGKTTLARAALHHPDIASKFEQRFFVSAEAATTSIELAALIGLQLGLDPGQDLTRAVVRHLARTPASLLILDNLETVWEDIQTRAGVENLLSLLSEVEHLALLITMRGAERPAQVQWTRPCLGPLQPLSNCAATQTFMDITDGAYSVDEVDQILQFTGNMPLAVELIAHLTDYEGLPNILSRWELEKTSILSVGTDRRSSLDTSIGLSLSSPRITTGSKELLSLLSILPNGLSDGELLEACLGIPNILSCKAVLLSTS